MINQTTTEKAILLTNKNNSKAMQKYIGSQNYIHIFISLKIALSKKFRESDLDHLRFTQRLSLLAIDKIYLVDD